MHETIRLILKILITALLIALLAVVAFGTAQRLGAFG